MGVGASLQKDAFASGNAQGVRNYVFTDSLKPTGCARSATTGDVDEDQLCIKEDGVTRITLRSLHITGAHESKSRPGQKIFYRTHGRERFGKHVLFEGGSRGGAGYHEFTVVHTHGGIYGSSAD